MTQTVRRAIDILYFVAASPGGRTLTEIASSRELSKPTAFRLAQTLVVAKLFRHDRVNRRYFLGEGMYCLAGLLQQQDEPLRELALGYMQELRDETRETISLVVPRGMDRFTIEVLPALYELKFVPSLYSTKPIYFGAPGKALLAFQPQRQIDRVLKEADLSRIAAGTTSPEKLMQDLERVRQLGFATSAEESVPGGAAVAAPIFDVRGEAVAALNVYGPLSRFGAEVLTRYGELAAKAAARISADLGAPARTATA